jgi:diadenosine tetraphosphate (Ap4A) HIT family hydrolase
MSLIFFKKWYSNSSVHSSHSRSHSRSRSSSSTGLLKLLSFRIFLLVTVVVLSSTLVLIFLVHPLLVVVNNDCRVDGFIVAKKKKSPAEIISPLSPSSSFSPPLQQQLQLQLQQEQEQMDSMDAAPPPSSPRDEEEGINNNDSNLNNLDYGYDYDSNPTVFGQILRGELCGHRPILKESENVIAFEDQKPKAKFHALIIPKRYIPTILDLDLDVNTTNNNNIIGIDTDTDTDTNNDITANIAATNKRTSMMLSLLEEMESTAETILKERYPEEYNNKDYILCFHIPPFTSVNHLHLHVLAPASQMTSFYRYGKYNCGSGSTTNNTNTIKNNNYNVRWCTSLQDVLLRLRTGLPPTTYKKDDTWTTIFSDATSSIRSILVSSLTR